jgi:hypothetical protein
MSSEEPVDGESDGYSGDLDNLDVSEEDAHSLGEDEYVDPAFVDDWLSAERARRRVVGKMDGINSVGEAAARRSLPPAEEGDDE